MRMQKLSLLFVFAALFVISFNVTAASCAPQVETLVIAPPYDTLNAALTGARVTSLKTKLDAVKNQATYATLLTDAKATAAIIPNGRVVITLADGTVVVDTFKGAANTYANYKAKTINENHNTRAAIVNTQLYECGVGVETKLSATTNAKEIYVAKRLGNYLDNSGTVRLSRK